MPSSLKKLLYSFLKESDTWIHGAELERYGMSLGFMADNVGRRLRELRREGSVESEKRGEGIKTCWWRYKTVESLIPTYRPGFVKSKIQSKLFTP